MTLQHHEGQCQVTCTEETWAWLHALVPNPTDFLHGLWNTMLDVAEGGMPKARVVDASRQMSRPARPKPKPAYPDRVDRLCEAVEALVASMGAFVASGEANDDQVQVFAQKYGQLTAEMRKLREDVRRAEGMFEIAQKQVVQMMAL